MNIGIDFGSTYSAFSTCVKEHNVTRAEILEVGEGDYEMPSLVAVDLSCGDEEIICGKSALNCVGVPDYRVFEAFKMLLPETDKEILESRGYDEVYNPRRITKEFLNAQLRSIRRRYPNEKFDQIVICVPELWSKVKDDKFKTLDGRAILREILSGKNSDNKEAEYHVDNTASTVRVVSEPDAASAYIAYKQKQNSGKDFVGHILIIDYGGGTLDITLTEVLPRYKGVTEVAHRDDGGAGENHPTQGKGAKGNRIGCAAIAYMQDVVEQTIRSAGIISENEVLRYSDGAFMASVHALEAMLKTGSKMDGIEDKFGRYNNYTNASKILNEPDKPFCKINYGSEKLTVTYQQLYKSYRTVVEPVLRKELEDINAKIKKNMGVDPTDPNLGVADNFKIALVGGFSSFYLVRMQIEEIYHFVYGGFDERIADIPAKERERAISMGAALVAEGEIDLQRIARFSIGVVAKDRDGKDELHFAIRYHQKLIPGEAHFIRNKDTDEDIPQNRLSYFPLSRKLDRFFLEWKGEKNRGVYLQLKETIKARLDALPQGIVWNIGFSMDESEMFTFHVVPSETFMRVGDRDCHVTPKEIPLGEFSELFEFSLLEEVVIE